MRKDKLYLTLAKPFLRIGNYLMNKHVKALRERQEKDGYRKIIVDSMILDAWNELSYVEGVLFTVWLFISYYGKCGLTLNLDGSNKRNVHVYGVNRTYSKSS